MRLILYPIEFKFVIVMVTRRWQICKRIWLVRKSNPVA